MTMITDIAAPTATPTARFSIQALLCAPIVTLARLDQAYRQNRKFHQQSAARLDDMGISLAKRAKETVWTSYGVTRH